MSGEEVPPADAGAPRGVWSTISPRFGVRPDWRSAAVRGRWPGGLALLFVIGLGGSIALLAVSLIASKVGYDNTLESELLKRPLVEQFVLVALLAPVIEELVFRLPLAGRLRLGVLAATGAIGVLNFAGGDGPVIAIAAMFGIVVVASGVLWIQSLIVGVTRDAAESESAPTPPTWRDSAARWWSSHPGWPGVVLDRSVRLRAPQQLRRESLHRRDCRGAPRGEPADVAGPHVHHRASALWVVGRPGPARIPQPGGMGA